MKKILFFFALPVFVLACTETNKSNQPTEAERLKKEAFTQAQADTTNLTQVEWLDSVDRKLGKLKANESVDIIWRFKNVGDKPLVVENATASCGCTVPSKPEKPIAPGETGEIKATFNGSGQGTILKQVHVLGNLKPNREKTLSFTGEIETN
ncbi:MAG: DUF1573 domain-containing protein [Bacteroidota bacterium]